MAASAVRDEYTVIVRGQAFPALVPKVLAQGTTQVSVMVAVCPAVTTADVGCEHGSSRLRPPSISITSGDRPETWYRPGGSGTENVPEDPTVTVTVWCPEAGGWAAAEAHPAASGVSRSPPSRQAEMQSGFMAPPHPVKCPLDASARAAVPGRVRPGRPAAARRARAAAGAGWRTWSCPDGWLPRWRHRGRPRPRPRWPGRGRCSCRPRWRPGHARPHRG